MEEDHRFKSSLDSIERPFLYKFSPTIYYCAQSGCDVLVVNVTQSGPGKGVSMRTCLDWVGQWASL